MGNKLKAAFYSALAALTINLAACSPKIQDTEAFKKLPKEQQEAILSSQDELHAGIEAASKAIQNGDIRQANNLLNAVHAQIIRLKRSWTGLEELYNLTTLENEVRVFRDIYHESVNFEVTLFHLENAEKNKDPKAKQLLQDADNFLEALFNIDRSVIEVKGSFEEDGVRKMWGAAREGKLATQLLNEYKKELDNLRKKIS